MYYSYISGDYSEGITKNKEKQLKIAKEKIAGADSILIGAGAGLSAAAGFDYSGKKFHEFFFDFEEKYNITDIYSGGFYPFPDEETFWAWWSRAIYLNRYCPAPNNLYSELFDLIKDFDYFVLTTNVDHQFQKAGFDKKRLFYTQGDYGLFQSEDNRIKKTYDNEEIIFKMMVAQGFEKDEKGNFKVPDDKKIKMAIPSDLIPICPDGGGKMKMNLRCDDSFVEDEGWRKAYLRYDDFIRRHKNTDTVYFELGVGMNTPAIIKFPFWESVGKNKNAFYISVTKGDAFCPDEIKDRAVCIDGDIREFIKNLSK